MYRKSDIDTITADITAQIDKSLISGHWNQLSSEDAFQDPPEDDPSWEEMAAFCNCHIDRQEQILASIDVIGDYQHRVHFFQLLIFGRRARFLRWDYSATIVSRSFDYIANSEILIQFFYRFARLTPTQMGLDERYTIPSLAEQELAKKTLCQWIVPTDRRSVVKLTVEDVHGKRHELLAWHHFLDRKTILGRTNRASFVYNLTLDAVMFYKEGWRLETLTPEATTLRTLNDANVPYVPTLICGGDVSIPGHITVNPNYSDRLWNSVHYEEEAEVRIYNFVLIKELARPLESASPKSARELLQVTYHAFIGRLPF